MYKVPSEKNKNCSYIVDIEVGTCTCFFGAQGRFCKHQAFLYNCFKCCSPNLPIVSAGDIVWGNWHWEVIVQNYLFFLGLHENICNSSSFSAQKNFNVVNTSDKLIDNAKNNLTNDKNLNINSDNKMIDDIEISSEYDINICNEIVRLKPLLKNLLLN